ncbi:hypothetical protein C8R44DRAFT_864937 [Mycena epipterygia]|nr:hypothetical protein C8R44DRAFT_864937 [Mycena epipterygia]
MHQILSPTPLPAFTLCCAFTTSPAFVFIPHATNVSTGPPAYSTTPDAHGNYLYLCGHWSKTRSLMLPPSTPSGTVLVFFKVVPERDAPSPMPPLVAQILPRWSLALFKVTRALSA